ncbi:hypothetical protein DFP72DRAFT_875270 [Ephemerocybe angulata]|uniref:DUF6699 domain-containing protein n=1 Tax=Ephemerocybe angulata TaxID=980116 RepID=A0A8H6ICZ8_9AGAR|nr:hypothetical protein DFP72DRAFT_875270 [Tulosesus angulatus]
MAWPGAYPQQQWNQPAYQQWPNSAPAYGPTGYAGQPTGYPAAGWNGAGVYSDVYSGRPPVTSSRSSKYPDLNPILAADTTLLRFDIKKRPRSEILASTYYTSRYASAKTAPTYHLRLISKAFPWAIDIHSAANVNITCEAIWDALWGGLQEPIVDSEWGFLIKDKKHREAVEAAVKKRLESEPTGDKRPKRIDYLGDVTLFKGLERDEEYEKLRHLPHSAVVPDTWLVKLTS